MRRAALSSLAGQRLDLLVVGGGIYGAMVAREAAGRGLEVALIDRGDFGAGASHNSMKVMHGGIRYVQHLDFARLRASARERAFWQACAAEHVRPLEFLIPMFGWGMRGPLAFGAAAALYSVASAGLRGPGYPPPRVLGPAAARARLGAHAPPGLTGGGLWRDGQIGDANRLMLAVLEAAAGQGALLANHVAATGLLTEGGRVVGAAVEDRVAGGTAEIRAAVTVSATGPAARRLARTAAPQIPEGRFPGFARAMNLVLRRPPPEIGLGGVSRSRSDAVVDRGGRLYFLTPWQGLTILGTHEAPHDGAETWTPAPQEIAAFLGEANHAFPALGLSAEDVGHCYGGLIPADIDDAAGPKRQTRGTLIDHLAADGVAGLISSVGIKYTTARLIAERTVALALAQLPGRTLRPFASRTTPLPAVGPAALDPDDAASVAARVRQAVQGEMALKLDDLVTRRSRLAETGGLAGSAGAARLERIAAAMASELGWDPARTAAEIAAVAGPG